MRNSQEVAEIIIEEAKVNKTSVHKMLLECGLAKKVVDNMKTGSMPAADKLAIIASYLGVSTDYLLGNENTKEKEIFEMDDLIRLDDNARHLISLLDSFDEEMDKIEFIGRARKLARDMRKEILREEASIFKEV